MNTKIIQITGLTGVMKVLVNIVTYVPYTFTYASIDSKIYTGSSTKGNPLFPKPEEIGKCKDLINLTNRFGAMFAKIEGRKVKYKINIEWYYENEEGQTTKIDEFEFKFNEEKEKSSLPNPLNPNFSFEFKKQI